MMALAGVELETLVSEPDALTTRTNFLVITKNLCNVIIKIQHNF